MGGFLNQIFQTTNHFPVAPSSSSSDLRNHLAGIPKVLTGVDAALAEELVNQPEPDVVTHLL
jgi:hypothetical protein